MSKQRRLTLAAGRPGLETANFEDVGLSESEYRTREGPRGVELAIRALAERQHGAVEHRQLLAIGLSPSSIRRRVRAGRLVIVHRGVYAVGHALLPVHGREMAAVLACGLDDELVPRGVLSHRTAGARLGLVRWTGRVEVTAPRARKSVPGVTLHRSRSLAQEDRTKIGPIPATTWARTLLDLATVLPHHQLVRAIENAMINRLYDHPTLIAAVQRAHGHHGIKALNRAIAATPKTPQKTRSPLEDLFLALIRSADPPIHEYEGNAVLVLGQDRFEIDALWRDERLAVELDSGVHDTPFAKARDAHRDHVLEKNSFSMLRFRTRDLVKDPNRALNRVRQHLHQP